MKNFAGFGLDDALLTAIDKQGYKTPTPIQAGVISFAMAQKDVLASAQTGTGKTGAFVIPIIHNLLLDPTARALIVTPTRELATQVLEVVKSFSFKMKAVKPCLLIGGAPMGKQLSELQGKPTVIVGTPGRINDHLKRRTLTIRDVKTLVLDETDRMLDMGFGIQIDEIIKNLGDTRQTMMFSATFPKEILKLTEKYLKNPEKVIMEHSDKPSDNLTHTVVKLSHAEKFKRLVDEVEQRTGSIIVFVATKRSADKMSDQLMDMDIEAKAIHGDLRQHKRERVLQAFRNKKCRILVATDVAARGLDVPHIEHVINYDLPQCPEDYIHRIGRTARAGLSGEAICFVAPADYDKWRMINRLLNPGDTSEDHLRSEPRNNNRRRSSSQGNGGGGYRGGFKGKSSGGSRRSSSEERSQGSSNRWDKPSSNFGKPKEDRWGGASSSDRKPREGGWSKSGPSERKPREGGWNNPSSSERKPKAKQWGAPAERSHKPRSGGLSGARGSAKPSGGFNASSKRSGGNSPRKKLTLSA